MLLVILFAELVKIDPKSRRGQYQHDINQKLHKFIGRRNRVGVDLNIKFSSQSLVITYCGNYHGDCQEIVAYREEKKTASLIENS